MNFFKQNQFAFYERFIPACTFFLFFLTSFSSLRSTEIRVIEQEFAVHVLDVAHRINSSREGCGTTLSSAKTRTTSINPSIWVKLIKQGTRNASFAGTAIQAGNIRVGDLGINSLFGVEHA